MISRGLLVVRSIQVFRPISALSLAKITRMFFLMLSLWSLLYALVAGVLGLEEAVGPYSRHCGFLVGF